MKAGIAGHNCAAGTLRVRKNTGAIADYSTLQKDAGFASLPARASFMGSADLFLALNGAQQDPRRRL
jgi:hypothetical protein